jgi:hypothetical protein
VITGLLFNLFYSVTLLFAISGLGMMILVPFRKALAEGSLISRATLEIFMGFTFYTLIIYEVAKYNQNVKLVSCIFFYLGILSKSLEIIRSIKTKNSFQNLYLLIAATICGIWACLPGLISMFRNGVPLGMVTRGNNDIAFYVAVAGEFIKTGFTNSNHIASIDLNFVANTSHYFTPTSLFTLASTPLGLKVWETAMFVSIACFAFSLLTLIRLSECIFKSSALSPAYQWVAAIVAMMSSLMTYVYGNYFLAQMLSIGLSALIITNCYEYFINKNRSPFVLFQTAALMLSSFFTYPHVLVPFFAVTCFYTYLFSVLKSRNFQVLILARFVAAVSVGTILAKDYIHFTIFTYRNMTNGTSAGWPIPTMNVGQLVIWPEFIGWRNPGGFLIATWVITFALFLFVFYRSKIEFNEKYFTLFYLIGSALSFMIFVKLRNQDFSDYTSWKLISYLLPIGLVLFTAVFVASFRSKKEFTLIALGAVLMTPMSMWSHASWDGVNLGVSLTKDMTDLAESAELRNIPNLNIAVAEFFETMALASIIDRPIIYPNAKSYFPVLESPNSCILVRANATGYARLTRINDSYSLASNTIAGCSMIKPKLVLNKVYLGSSKQISFFEEGWSAPEAWGLWSDGERSVIRFEADLDSGSGYVLRIKSAGYVVPLRDSLLVNVKINGQPVKEILYTTTNQMRTDSFPISPAILSSALRKGEIEVVFEINNPISPKILGESEDSRRLGLGLISFELTNS